MKLPTNSLFWRITSPVPLLMGAGILAMLLVVPRAVEWNIKTTAEENALELVRDFRSIRNFYTTYVVEEALRSGDIDVTHLHRDSEKSIPAPATFLMEMTREMGGELTWVNLLSPFPFPGRERPPLDAFQRDAWQHLTQNPDDVLTRVERVDGKDVVRIAVADRLQYQACVDCHNNHPDSPKHGWSLGDVRGVLEVRSFVGPQFQRGTYLSIGMAVMLGLGALFMILINGMNARAIAGPLTGMAQALKELAAGNRSSTRPEKLKTKEVQTLWEAFQVLREKDEEREALNRQVYELAYYDSLTTLPNRELFRERLEQEIRRAEANPDLLVAVVLLDLDRFRDVNNTLGHDAGDILLKQLGERLNGLEGQSMVVARMSEDEFGILICQRRAADAKAEPAASAIRKIIEAVEDPICWQGHSLNLSGSVGVAVYPTDGVDRGTLMKNADLALYHAKEEGRRTYRYYSEDFEAEVAARVQMIRDMHTAIQREEFYPCFQPQHDVQTGSVIGAELLLRWRRADGTEISPVDFIPVAERSGLIVPIGRSILQQACRLGVEWQRQGLRPIRLAVNVSAVELEQDDFVESVEAALIATGFPPRHLELELTESATMRDVESIIRVLAQLRALGVELAVDDFGTGYSSLSYLKRLPINRLKIDQSFVRHLTTDENDASITRTIIALAKNLDLNVIAEGVEEIDHVRFLADHDCDEAQGYHFSRPLPVDEFVDYLRRHQENEQLVSA